MLFIFCERGYLMAKIRYGVMLFLVLVVSCVNNEEDVHHGTMKELIPAQDLMNRASPSSSQIMGQVLTEDGIPIEGAIVRIQTTDISTTSKADGSFLLNNIAEKDRFQITAYSPGYYIKEADVSGGMSEVQIRLHAHNLSDNPDYEWLSAGIETSPSGEGIVCVECHASTEEGVTLPFDEWALDAHASSGKNPRFFSMYNGTDLNGNKSPLTDFAEHRDYGLIPIRPTIDESYFGPGFLLDFPEKDGNCSACHQPLDAVANPYFTNPNSVSQLSIDEGINCDFCHKIWNVKLDPNSGLPYSNMPGVVSIEFLRPPQDHQLFIGPLDDVAPGEDTYSALQNQSEYCAACHFGDFWGVQIYNSFGEWLASDYAITESENFQTCQDCHMPPVGNQYFARVEDGGLIRDPSTILSHKMLGINDAILMENTFDLDVKAEVVGETIVVDVSLVNSGAGHHVPTDSPLRQVFLVVNVMNEEGDSLELVEGSILPAWAGDLEGLPGKYYAKILEQLWTEIYPTGAYWTQTRIREDTRLEAFQEDRSRFVFRRELSNSENIVEVQVIFRRAFYDLMKQKGWDDPDLLMESEEVILSINE